MRLPRRRTPPPPAPTPQVRRRVRLLALVTVAGAAAVAATSYVVLSGDEVPERAAPIHVTGSTFIAPFEVKPQGPRATREPAGMKARPDRSAGRSSASGTGEPGSPRRLLIPSLGVDSEVVPISAPGGTLTPPSDGQQVGWWSAGAEPGAKTGSALVTGHTFSRGGAALQDLEDLEPGDLMSVRTDSRNIAYRVQDVEVFSKGTVAAEAAALFSQSVAGRLVVITCEDYNGSAYLSNVVVTAVPIGRATRS